MVAAITSAGSESPQTTIHTRLLKTTPVSWAAAQLARQQAHIGVYKALGGGWVAEQGAATVQPTTNVTQPATP